MAFEVCAREIREVLLLFSNYFFDNLHNWNTRSVGRKMIRLKFARDVGERRNQIRRYEINKYELTFTCRATEIFKIHLRENCICPERISLFPPWIEGILTCLIISKNKVAGNEFWSKSKLERYSIRKFSNSFV